MSSFKFYPVQCRTPPCVYHPCVSLHLWVQVFRREEGGGGPSAGLPSPPLPQARKQVTGSAHTAGFTLQDSTGPLDTASALASSPDGDWEPGWRTDRQTDNRQTGAITPEAVPGLATPCHPPRSGCVVCVCKAKRKMHLGPRGQHSVMHQDAAHCVLRGSHVSASDFCPGVQDLSLGTSEPMGTWTRVLLEESPAC